jgi:hypothetical protein
VIVYLMTLIIAGTVSGRAVVQTVPDCHALAARIAANDHTPYEVKCEALPMYFMMIDPPPKP